MKHIQRRIVELELHLVEPNPTQPREDAADTDIESLAKSIDATGIQNLTIIEPHPDKKGYYLIISGERRWRALNHLGQERAEFMLIEAGGDPFLMSVVENKNRKSLNPIEEAKTIVRLRSEPYKMSWAEVADLLGETATTLQNRRRLLDMPSEIQEMVRTGNLPSISTLKLQQFSSDKGRMLKIAHDLADGKEAPEFHLPSMTARGLRAVHSRLPEKPEDFARRIARLLGKVQTFPAVITAFMELPKADRAKALQSIDPSVNGKMRKATVTLTSSLRILASEMEVELTPGQARKGDATLATEPPKIPPVSIKEAHYVLSHVIRGTSSSLVVDLSKSSLGKKLQANGHSPEVRVIGSFRCLQEHWGLAVPKGKSVDRDFMMFLGELRRKLGSPKFRRALVILKGRDTSSDPVNLDLV